MSDVRIMGFDPTPAAALEPCLGFRGTVVQDAYWDDQEKDLRISLETLTLNSTAKILRTSQTLHSQSKKTKTLIVMTYLPSKNQVLAQIPSITPTQTPSTQLLATGTLWAMQPYIRLYKPEP